MGIKRSVFASRAERENFEKLARTWGQKQRLYHNLPFLNIFDFANLIDLSDWPRVGKLEVNDRDKARLKKTSVDYTLCDEQDVPILCVEFDGLCDGFNVGTDYHPTQPNPYDSGGWRKTITELKLRVARGSLFPFFVVGYDYFRDVSADIRLTIVDGLIGSVLERVMNL